MKSQTKLTLIAAAVGGLMAGAASHAMAAAPTAPGVSTRTAVSTGTSLKSNNAGIRMDDKDAGKHDCKGMNDCKGQGGCKTGDAGCKGKNTCKGKGGCKTNGDQK